MTAGTRDAMPATSSRAPSGSRDLRATPPTTDAAATALRTAGRWNGSLASGSARRTSGSTAKDSASRSGPRTSGTCTPGANLRFRPEADLIVPSGSRPAHPRAVGPWTSTPLARAMPPSRTCSMTRGYRQPLGGRSGWRRQGELPQRSLELVGSRASLESALVDRDDRHHLAYGRRGKGFVGVPKHGVERERALDHAVATLRRELHQCGARLAGEDAELETGRVQGAAHAPPDVGDRPFEHDPVCVDEEGIVESPPLGLQLGRDVRG